MSVRDVKKQLHDYIDQANDKHLQAIYLLLGKEINSYSYNIAELEMLYGRHERHLKGISKSFNEEDEFRSVRENKKPI